MAKLDLSKYADFVPAPEFFESLPEIAGNELNGLGEPDIRPPDPILWHADTSTSPFGDLQKWYQKSVGLSVGAKSHRMANVEFRKKPLSPVAEEGPDWTAEEWAANIKKAAIEECEADAVGIVRIDPNWIFDTI